VRFDVSFSCTQETECSWVCNLNWHQAKFTEAPLEDFAKFYIILTEQRPFLQIDPFLNIGPDIGLHFFNFCLLVAMNMFGKCLFHLLLAIRCCFWCSLLQLIELDTDMFWHFFCSLLIWVLYLTSRSFWKVQTVDGVAFVRHIFYKYTTCNVTCYLIL